MICADCKRALRANPALTIGEYHFGPKCARRYIIKPTRATNRAGHRFVCAANAPQMNVTAPATWCQQAIAA